MKTNKITTLILGVFFFLTGSINLYAAGEDNLDQVMQTMMIVTLVFIIGILFLTIVYSEKNDNEGKILLRPLSSFMKWLTKTTPIEKEQEIMFHHDFDGIKELDNKIPPWFNILFYGSIIWSVIYMFVFHIAGDGNIQIAEYQTEIQAASTEREILIKTGAFLNEETVTVLTDAPSLSEGKDIYLKNCASCHGNNGEGMVGPNLTDSYWIHGGDIKSIFKTIKYGVPAKGMISWESQLAPKKMQEVSSYIKSLHGTNPANAKAQEGTLYEEPAEGK
ncbi:MAG: cbb3-type cytochrome c oxidase N-terminal domain-containing protein [Ignavibacteriaceae bacterium]|jgi:cytochrome c oxidase cbb3-type subunit 3|nr:cbb3-type cytochrome c oxidase N-terminal domain-containing protein [Ignavibacteriaceae bacterium]